MTVPYGSRLGSFSSSNVKVLPSCSRTVRVRVGSPVAITPSLIPASRRGPERRQEVRVGRAHEWVRRPRDRRSEGPDVSERLVLLEEPGVRRPRLLLSSHPVRDVQDGPDRLDRVVADRRGPDGLRDEPRLSVGADEQELERDGPVHRLAHDLAEVPFERGELGERAGRRSGTTRPRP